jgi:uracil permease
MNYVKFNLLAMQHLLAMFGATVLVPFITHMDTSIALLSAGIGTLIFHLFTKGVVPVFLGSSFAFIPVILLTLQNYDHAHLKGGIISAGLVYIAIAFMIKLYGNDKISKLFPSIVLGPIIMAIGLRLTPIALSMAGYSNDNMDYKSLFLAFVALFVMIFVSFIQKSFFRFIPILVSIIVSYLVALYLGMVDLSAVKNSPWFGLSDGAINTILTMPQFSVSVIFLVAPIALVTFVEHIGDINTNGSVVGKDFVKNPGLHRTLLGDGLATLFAGLIGGPANTTYSENTAVLASTKVYNPVLLRLTALFAILIALVAKISILITTLPTPIMGGISLILFGLIFSIGLKNMMKDNLNFNNYKNLIIPACVISVGVFVNSIKITDNLVISGLFLATVLGVVLNKVLPDMD